MSMTALPLELLLDIMELLLAERGKVSYRAAAGLAQACRSLRTSEAGKRARYFHALALRSMSVPNSLPADLDYEMEVLCTSRWPHEDPVDDPDDSRQVYQLGARSWQHGAITGDRLNAVEDAKLKAAAEAMDSASDVFLRGDTVIALDPERLQLLVGVARALPMSHELKREMENRDERSIPRPYSWARAEAIALSKVIQLDSKVTRMAVDSDDGKILALVYAEPEDQGKVVVEMRSLESGNVMGHFLLRQPSSFQEMSSIQSVHLMGDYLRLQESGGPTEVRRWRKTCSQEPDPDCPIVWENPLDEYPYFLSLLAPHFMATIYAESLGMQFHRLDQPAGSTLVAILDFSLDLYDESAIDYVVCGSKIAPGEEGLVVIQNNGTVWLLELSVLVRILYQGLLESDRDLVTRDEDGVVTYSEEWIINNTYRFLPIRREFANWTPSVSGWKCAFLFGPRKHIFEGDLSYIKFLDMSTTRQLGCGSTEQSPARCFKWKDRHFFTWDSPIESYLPMSVKQVTPSIARIELHGARLLLYYSPDPGTHERSHLRLWRT